MSLFVAGAAFGENLGIARHVALFHTDSIAKAGKVSSGHGQVSSWSEHARIARAL